jgi:hypothetical protein
MALPANPDLERIGTTAAARTYIGRMVRLQIISADAFAAIVATLPGNVNVENKRAANGDVYVWLDPATVARLKALRDRATPIPTPSSLWRRLPGSADRVPDACP